MILDAQGCFSNLASGDSPTAVQDNPSANYIDQMPGGLNFSAPGGGAYVAPWLVVQVRVAFATSASGTIIAVLQDAPEPSTSMVPTGPVTWTDRIVGASFSAAQAAANAYLLVARLDPSMARYLRVVYRIGTGVMTAGTVQSFLTLDREVVDIALRTATATVSQSGQISEAVVQGILGQ